MFVLIKLTLFLSGCNLTAKALKAFLISLLVASLPTPKSL